MNEPTDEQLLAELRGMREELRLATDDATAARLLADYRQGRFDGMWLLDEERDELVRSEEDLSSLADRVEGYGRSEGRDAYAGVWIERHARVVAAFTHDVGRHHARLRRLTGERERLDARRARYTEDELQAVCERLTSDWERLRTDGVDLCSFGPFVVENRVRASVIAADPRAARQMMRGRYGDVVIVSVIATEPYRIEAAAWDSWTIADDDRTLTLHWFTNSVHELDSIEADERPHHIRVTLRERVPNGPVTLAGAERHAEVELRAPLAGRTVLDGATGDERPSGGARR